MSVPKEAAAAAERGLERLVVLARELRGEAPDRAGLIGCLLEAEPLTELAWAFRLRRTEYTAALLKARVHGAAKHLDVLDAAVAERAAELGRAASDADGRPSIRKALRAPAEWADYPVPSSYSATSAGVCLVRETPDGIKSVPVCSEPLYVVSVQVDVGTAQESLTLGYRRFGGWRQAVLRRDVARDARQLVAHAVSGLPVSSVNSRRLVEWIDACEATASREDRLQRLECTTRLGWHGDTYVSGPGSALQLVDELGDRTGWVPSGTWDGWCDGLSIVAEEPLAWALLFVASVPPLLRFLDLGHNPIVDLSGPQGRGKTTILRLCGSVYGRPDEREGGTLVTWDGSAAYLERIAAQLCDVPLLNDETTRKGRLDVGSTIYQLAQGRGRGRASIEGIRRTATWRTVVISTGEAPVVEFTEAGGARARVLSFVATPALSSADVAQALENAIAVHHGHLGVRLAEWALSRPKGWLRERHRQCMEAWRVEHRTADTRLLSTVAAIEVAAEACRAVGVPAPPATWREALEAALEASVAFADQPSNALDLLRAELSMHPSAYLRRDVQYNPDGTVRQQHEPNGGWRGVIGGRGDGWVGFYPPTIRKILVDAGHNMTSLLTRWAEDKVLVKGTHGRQLEVTIDQHKHRVYAFQSALLT